MSGISERHDERSPLLRETSSYEHAASGTVTPVPLNKPSKTDLYWVLGALWSAVFLGALDGTIVATLLTSIGSHFDRAHQASYLGTSYLLSVAAFTPLYGRLSDILGRKGAMLLALSLFGSGTVLCGIAPSMESLIIARAIAGMGGGGVMIVSSITTTDLIPLQQRGLYQGLANILFGIGSGLGGPLGGLLNDRFGWRWAFLAQVPIMAISFVLVCIKVDVKLPNQNQTVREKMRRVDILGSLTLVLGIGSLLLGVTLKTSEELQWSNPIVWSLLTGSAVSLVAFILVEKHVAVEPILPMRLLTARTPLSVALVNLLLSMGSFSMLYNIPIYFLAVRLQRASDAGLHLLPNAVALAIGSVGAGIIMRRTGKYYYLNLAGAALFVFSSLLVAMWRPGTGSFELWFDIVPAGIGLASLITSTLIALIASVDREDVAVATGISYLFRTTGQVLGVSLTGVLLQTLLLENLRAKITGPNATELIQAIRHSITIIPTLDPATRQAVVDSYASALRIVFLVQTAIAFCAFLCCLPIEENPLAGSHEEQAEHERQRRERRAALSGAA